MSIDEIEDKINSYDRQIQAMRKERATLNYVLADQISQGIAKIFDSKNEIERNHLWDYFPSLFEKEKLLYEHKKEENEFEEFKSARREFARKFNEKMKGE